MTTHTVVLLVEALREKFSFTTILRLTDPEKIYFAGIPCSVCGGKGPHDPSPGAHDYKIEHPV
jgi:hypothetical protein